MKFSKEQKSLSVVVLVVAGIALAGVGYYWWSHAMRQASTPAAEPVAASGSGPVAPPPRCGWTMDPGEMTKREITSGHESAVHSIRGWRTISNVMP